MTTRAKGRVPVPETPAPANAITAYRRLSFAEQVALVEEIITTRAAELRAAHPGVIGLGLGLKRRRGARGIPRTQSGMLHLRFMVKRKWPESGAASQPRRDRIPRHVLVGIGPLDDRTLVAVPTDVEARPPRHHARRQSAPIRAWTGESYAEGAVACVLQQTQSGAHRYFGVSCRHVLSPTGNPAGLGPPASQVDEIGEPALQLGSATARRGSMSNPNELDFDAQLFAFDSAAAAAAVVAEGLSLPGPPVTSVGQLSGTLHLWAPSSNTPLAVTFHTLWTFPEPVVPGLLDHRQLLEMTLTGTASQAGDSGSPLLLPGEAPSLAGMHLALRQVGTENLSLCIPVWDLLNPVLYGFANNPPGWRVM